MSMRRQKSQAHLALESLEDRQLLSKTISGVDPDGDHWTMTLIGPGDFRVINQPNAAGDPVPIGQPAEIDKITIAGPDPLKTRLIGKVVKGPNGDGKVFFESLTEQGQRSEGQSAADGMLAIDMPGFWLGHTSTAAPSTTDPTEDAILLPDGIQTLRFGGVDTKFTPPGGTPLNQNGTSDPFSVDLGLPRTQGTSIIIDKSVSSGQAATSTGGSATQDSVTFNVNGRLNEFQANEIDGNTAVPTTPFRGGGGTLVVSQPDPLTAITGSIGFIRVGGNATNFSVQSGGADGLLSNSYIGGEPNNVQLLATGGMRNVYFGTGMDTTTILTHSLMTLKANRGALNSTVGVERAVGTAIFGGPVVGSTLRSGVNLNLGGTSGVFATQTAPTLTPAQDGGAIHNVLVAGDVTNSVFAASVEPDENGQFGTSNNLVLPHGIIQAKVQGTVNNSIITPVQPTQAFYAKLVKFSKGPVVPPRVPVPPFPDFGAPPTGFHVVHHLQRSFPTTVTPHGSAKTTTKSTSTAKSTEPAAAPATTHNATTRPKSTNKKTGR
jgi:hypothetical protein